MTLIYSLKNLNLQTRRQPQSRGKSENERDCIAASVGERTKLKYVRHEGFIFRFFFSHNFPVCIKENQNPF